MLGYILRRLIWIVITLWGVSLLTFGLLFAGPTDAAQALSGARAQAASVEMLRQQLGLDRPVHEQYLTYLGGLVRGDLGESYYFKRPVADALRERFPATAQLALTIFVLAVALGVPLGVVSAMRRGGVVDRTLMVTGLVAISIPSFLFGLLLLYLFAFRLKLFPVGGYGSPAHLVLPALTVALPWAAWYGIVLRSNMLDAVALDFARTAAAKGLGPVDHRLATPAAERAPLGDHDARDGPGGPADRSGAGRVHLRLAGHRLAGAASGAAFRRADDHGQRAVRGAADRGGRTWSSTWSYGWLDPRVRMR